MNCGQMDVPAFATQLGICWLDAMKSNPQIVAGGGWPEKPKCRQAYGRPKLKLFAMLSLCGVPVSAMASYMLWRYWLEPAAEELHRNCGVLLALHLLCVVLALGFWLFEKPHHHKVAGKRGKRERPLARNLY